MGHIISEDGIATDPSKVEKVAQWPASPIAKEVQQFLGLAGYYRRFIRSSPADQGSVGVTKRSRSDVATTRVLFFPEEGPVLGAHYI